MEDVNMKYPLMTKSNLKSNIDNSILTEIIENTLYFITELETEKYGNEEAIYVGDLPADLKKVVFNNSESENEDIPEDDNHTNDFIFPINDAQNFLISCSGKIKKGIRLNIEEKQNIINLYKSNPILYSMSQISDTLNIERSTVSRWIKNEKQYNTIEKTTRSNLPGQGKKSYFDANEKDLITYSFELRKENIAVNSYLLIEKMYSLNNDLKNKSFNAVHKLLYRILKKNNITLRKATHLGQPLPDHSFDKIYEFIYEIIKQRKKLKIEDDVDNLNRFINVDETPVYLEIISDKTYDVKGVKEVIINTKGNEKSHVTLILAVAGSGGKLPPVVIFKGKLDKNNEKRYNKLDVVKDKRIFVYFQENAQVNDYIFKKWLDEVYLEHEKKIHQKCLLLLDKAPSHITSDILKHLEGNQTEYTFIPGKLTRFLPPLVIGINKPFKSQLKNKYLLNETNKFKNIKEENTIMFHDNLVVSNLDKLKLNLINWILLIWEDNSSIKPSSIIASFNKATIIYPLDGSLDKDFEMPEEIINQHNKE